MVATIHRDPYHLLIRKIGYSVGLEKTLDRVRDLVTLYAEELSVTSGNLSILIRDEAHWNLSTNNIIDVFDQLDLVRSEANTIFVLPTLDALGILKLKLGPGDFETALRAVLLYAILSSDGDIFLNCLEVRFDKQSVRDQLTEMIQEKRRLAKQALASPRAMQKIDRFINIEAQKGNRGGAVAGQGVNALHRREPLASQRGPLATDSATEIQISDDYLRKVPGRRRDWARSLDLVDESEILTPLGHRLTDLFTRLGQRTGSAVTFWPYADELPQLNLRPEDLPWPTPEREDVIKGLKFVLTNCDYGERHARPRETLGWLHEVFDTYRTLNPGRSMVRVELPLRVARLVALGYSCANHGLDHDVVPAVDASQSDNREVGFRPSRQHEGSIVFRGL